MNAPIKSTQISGEFEPNPVLIKGEGKPVVFLHGLLGQEWDACLDDLSESRCVYAPAHAGSDEPDELRNMDGIYDLVIYYDDLFRKLGLGQIDLIGHSFGGMVAAEIAAAYPDRVRKLVLIDSLGLWRDDAPVEDYLLIPPDKQVSLLLGDPTRADIQAKLVPPEDPDDQVKALLHRYTSLASVSHFIWPIPERGLAKRLHRVSAETLILWGADDKLVPSVHAQDFAEKIASSEVEIVPGAGHTPQFDQPTDVSRRIRAFLDR